MEIIVTLSSINNLNKVRQSGADGILFGGPFSLRFNYSIDELKIINTFCLTNNIKRYISIDAFIFENDKVALYEYFELLKELNVDGIYFADLGIIDIARGYGLDDRLSYDPNTLMTNSLDSAFYLSKGISAVLARELTLEETTKILKKLPNQIDMQVFGHLRLSYSKRKFLSNYFKHLGTNVNVDSKKTLRLEEENRSYSLPIIEDKYGTRIYTDYVLLMYEELLELRKYIRRAILDDSFIKDNNLVFSVVKGMKKLTNENVDFLLENLNNKYQDINFSKGYLYTKTSLLKEEANNE